MKSSARYNRTLGALAVLGGALSLAGAALDATACSCVNQSSLLQVLAGIAVLSVGVVFWRAPSRQP